MSHKLIIVGAFHEIIELAEDNDIEIIGLIDKVKKNNYMGYDVLGSDSDANIIINRGIPLLITPDLPKHRQKLVEHYSKLGFEFSKLISKHAKISKSSIIDSGTIIQYGVNVSAGCKIGKFVKLNTFCNIMHDAIIGNFTTIAPNAVVLGNVKIGEMCYIGSNSTILPNIQIGNNVIVGAGAVVTKDIEDNLVIAGNPARKLNKNENTK